MSYSRLTTLAFLLLKLFFFVLYEIDLVSALYLEYPSEYFDGTWWKQRTGQDNVLCTRMTTAFLTFGIISLCYI